MLRNEMSSSMAQMGVALVFPTWQSCLVEASHRQGEQPGPDEVFGAPPQARSMQALSAQIGTNPRRQPAP